MYNACTQYGGLKDVVGVQSYRVVHCLYKDYVFFFKPYVCKSSKVYIKLTWCKVNDGIKLPLRYFLSEVPFFCVQLIKLF